MYTKHVEVHLFQRTPAGLELAKLLGLLTEDESNEIVCAICSGALVFFYVLLGERDTTRISCDSCLNLAVAQAML